MFSKRFGGNAERSGKAMISNQILIFVALFRKSLFEHTDLFVSATVFTAKISFVSAIDFHELILLSTRLYIQFLLLLRLSIQNEFLYMTNSEIFGFPSDQNVFEPALIVESHE